MIVNVMLGEGYSIMSRNKRFIFLLIMILFLSGCKFQGTNSDPEINAIFTISELSNKDFDDIGTKGFNIEDFRKVNISITVKNNTNITDREISLPNIKDVMNSYDIERYWYGEYVTSNNPNEDAEYRYDIMFLSKGLSEDDIKSVFTDSNIIVSWTSKEDKKEKRTINLTDIITFE